MSGATALALAAAFNLACTGSQAKVPGKGIATELTDYSEVYRVDLERKRWCSGECTETSPIYKVTEDRITFYYSFDPRTLNGSEASVSRESGAYVADFKFGEIVAIKTGQCETAPFTGFPSRKF